MESIATDAPAETATFAGRVIVPGEPDYDAARTVHQGGIDRRPAAIVRVAGAADASRVIRFARETGFELAVRGGGHSAAGHSTTDGGIVLDLTAMKALEIDSDRRVAWAETGLTAGEYTAAAAAHGLATGFGDSGSVGIGGLTLGGGVGFLLRKHGMTIDDLLAAEIVTADGEIVFTDAERHPDLFWAIRGGGGNFGVATRLKLRLHPLAEFTGGPLVLPATPEAIVALATEAAAAPDELTVVANVMPAPPLPFVPAERQGERVILAFVAFAGPAGAARRALAPIRSVADPIADLVRPMPYAEMLPPEEPARRPDAALRTLFADAIDDAAAIAIVERLEQATAPMAVTQIRVLGGAMARVPAAATAFAHRDRALMVNVAAVHGGRGDVAEHEDWVERLAAELRDDRPGAYVNFLGDEGPRRVGEAYPRATWERLAAVKARYDPGNLFRGNHNVPPAERHPRDLLPAAAS